MHCRSWFVASLPVFVAALGIGEQAVALANAPLPAEGRWTDLGEGALKDGRTGLEWTRQDSGREMDWNQAARHCSDLQKGWRLPTLAELKGIYEGTVGGTLCGHSLCHVSARFELSGEWFWSATPVGSDGSDGSELNWGVLMVNGAQTPSVRELAYGARALCVRSAS